MSNSSGIINLWNLDSNVIINKYKIIFKNLICISIML